MEKFKVQNQQIHALLDVIHVYWILNKLVMITFGIFVKMGCHVQGKRKESEISVPASTLCWSVEPLKVALKVIMISTTCFIKSLFEWISAFERAVEWTVKDSFKDSLLLPLCGATMKLHWLTAHLHAGEMSTEKVSCPVRFEDQH